LTALRDHRARARSIAWAGAVCQVLRKQPTRCVRVGRCFASELQIPSVDLPVSPAGR
jgi:hypothetical protein